MLPGERGAAGGDRLRHARLDRPGHVEVALHEDRPLLADDRVAGPGEAVEDAALRVDRGLGGVQVLGLAAVERARAEGHHLARLVQDREDRAVAEAVVVALLALPLEDEAGLLQERAERTSPAARRGGRPRRRARRPARIRSSVSFRKPRPRRYSRAFGPRGGPEGPREVLGRRLHEREHLLALLAVGPGLDAALGHRHAEAAGQHLDGLGEAHPLAQHQELEDVAALAAAEAVEDGRLLAHVEGRALLLVERAQALPRRPHLPQRHVLGDDAHDVRDAPHLLDEAVREGHR